MDYMADTGIDSLKGEDILKVAPQKYSSTVQYPNTPIARKLKGIAQVHLADLGSRIFYCDHSTFDTHAGQNPAHGNLWTAVTEGVDAFMKDLREHDHADNVIMLLFSEFGRRVRDNGSGPITAPAALPSCSARRSRAAIMAKCRRWRPPSWFRATSTRTWTSAASTRRSSTSG